LAPGGTLFTTGAKGACPREPTGGGGREAVVVLGWSGGRGAMGACPGGRLGLGGSDDDGPRAAGTGTDGDAARGRGGGGG
jgi:hypothetical protein